MTKAIFPTTVLAAFVASAGFAATNSDGIFVKACMPPSGDYDAG